jgi:hypothetical protein
LLFAIDKKLGIAGGFVYAPDCKALQGQVSDGGTVHCGAELGGSGDGSGSDGDSSSDGDGGGCGGGCGGGD